MDRPVGSSRGLLALSSVEPVRLAEAAAAAASAGFTTPGPSTGRLTVWSSGEAPFARTSTGPGDWSLDLCPPVWGGATGPNAAGPTSVPQPPPSAHAVVEPSGRLTLRSDPLGFRQLYAVSGPGWAGVSTSASALARLASAKVDPRAAMTQSLLGWQLGDSTWWEGVTVLARGASVVLSDGTLEVGPRSGLIGGKESIAPADVRGAVLRVAEIIRSLVERFLDERPDGLLQLTGGQDSRILLAAVPAERRRDVTAMTVDVPGSDDSAIAAMLCSRFGMPHVLLRDEGDLPEDVLGSLDAAAARLDGMADPFALASLDHVEAGHASAPRLSGLGGEVMRGFYYTWPVRPRRVTRPRAAQLARWRLFPNEAVSQGALDESFEGRRELVLDHVESLLRGASDEWHGAVDAFYLDQRMRRWAGVLASATADRRPVLNPMLDPEVLACVMSLPPRAKAGSRFLTQVLLELDPDLADIPLDGRPAPRVYVQRGPRAGIRRGALIGAKVVGKVAQLARRRTGTVGVGERLAQEALAQWRADPAGLDGVRGLGVMADAWLDDVLDGGTRPTYPEMVYVANLRHVAEQS